MDSSPDRDQRIIVEFAKRLAEAAGASYDADPDVWQMVAMVALEECGDRDPKFTREPDG